MSDLTGKFGALSTQLATQHTELMDALSTIAYALGAPPSAPEFTIEDIVLAIADSNTLLTGIRADMNEQLTNIFNTLDTINNNASLNAQRILMLMLQTACPCDTTVPLIPPPLETDPTEATNTAKCQRIQYFLDLFRSWVITVGTYLNEHGNISSYAIYNLLWLVLEDVGITDSELNNMSISTRDNLATLLNTYDTPSNINAGLFDAMYDGGVLVLMREALYGADNATDGKDAADVAIGGSSTEYPALIVAMFYTSWANVIYSAVPVVDASAYDGEICAPDDENCFVVESVTYASTYQYIPFGSLSEFAAYADTIASDGLGLNANYQYSAEWVSGSTSLQWEEFDNFGNWHSYVPVTSTSGPIETEIVDGRIYLASTENQPFTARVCILTPL